MHGAPAPPPALPTAVVGGYLGAGKTTLVNHLLRHAGGRRIAVLVNDFGDVGIDAALIEGNAAGVLSLAGGCLCCSFGDDLLGTLASLARRDPAPDYCLIELSGVALPGAVLRTLQLAPGVRPLGTLVLADAAEIRRQAGDRYVGDTVRRQLLDADWLLLNKADTVDGEALQATERWLRAQAPQARRWAGRACDVPAELLLGWPGRGADVDAEPRGVERAFARRPLAPPAAATVFDSRSLALPDGVDLDALGAALAATDSGVLRAKALGRDAGGAGRLLQVTGRRWQVGATEQHGPGRLVMIGLRGRWDPEALTALLSAAGAGAQGDGVTRDCDRAVLHASSLGLPPAAAGSALGRLTGTAGRHPGVPLLTHADARARQEQPPWPPATAARLAAAPSRRAGPWDALSGLQPRPGADAPAPAAQAAGPGVPGRDRHRVLAAEDDEVDQRILVESLTRLGCDVHIAGDGRQAVQAFAPGRFTLVLMHCRMPEMDGFDATRAIRHRERREGAAGRVPIVALTAHAMDADRQRCLDAGMDDHLAKPYTLEQLQAVLRRWCVEPAAPAAAP